MKPTILTQNKDITAVLLVEILVLGLPLVAMKLNTGVSWTTLDFATAGTLVAVTGILYVILSRLAPKLKLTISIVLTLAFLYLWAELAVGIFFNWGS